MSKKNRFSVMPISSLFFSVTFLAIGYGMVLTYIGVYLKGNGINDIAIGLINSSFFLGAILSSIFSQSIISKVGHIRSYANFAALMVTTFLLQYLFFNEFLWGFLRFVAGFCYFSILIIIESWLNEKATSEIRGKVLAIYEIIFYLSIALGQLFLTMDNLSSTIFVLGSVLVLVSIPFIALTKIKEPELLPFERYSLPKIYKIVPLATTTSFIGGIFIGSFFTMAPVYVLAKFQSVEVVSYFMLIGILGGLIAEWPVGIVSDKYGRRKIIAIVSFITAISSSLFLFIGLNTTLLYICSFLLGLTIFSLYPLSLARANDVLDEDADILEISRTLLFTYGLGSFVAPIIVGFLFKFYDNSMFVLYSVVGIYLTFYSLSKKRVADDELSTFVNVPITSGANIADLDPRTDREAR
ncbi:MFS transporter [Halarcobacter ebronensis]|uniref:MFS transporter n=1 Tax=Halarcobacter ebronensis TaxID=1462615 RepID=A0A4Q1AWV9_9BACT|nr:MFS transporter [Halarcobacter ebronensis]QKF83147.1 major facilitator superfamily transporter [Halarcobacter ebronensis]RXK05215.1 MFS transporter [Halarcobacter ebronensis]